MKAPLTRPLWGEPTESTQHRGPVMRKVFSAHGVSFSPHSMMNQEQWARIQHPLVFTTTNAFKFDALHGMVAIKTHHPTIWSWEQMEAMFTVGLQWWVQLTQDWNKWLTFCTGYFERIFLRICFIWIQISVKFVFNGFNWPWVTSAWGWRSDTPLP